MAQSVRVANNILTFLELLANLVGAVLAIVELLA
jgi:hypothetical protein